MASSIFIFPFGISIVGPGSISLAGPILIGDGTATAPSYSFANGTDDGLYLSADGVPYMSVGGVARVGFYTQGPQIQSTSSVSWSSGVLGAASDTFLARDAANTIAQKNGTNAQAFNLYFSTTGSKAVGFRASEDGILRVSNQANTAAVTLSVPTGTANTSPVVVGGSGQRKVGATNAQTIGSFTVGAADATFRISANILVTTATTHAFTVTCAYTDEGNTARTLTLNFSTLAGVISNTAIGNAGGTVPYTGVTEHIRCKAATTITIATVGVFTTVVYNGEGYIEQMG